jgi:hypothetical protein
MGHSWRSRAVWASAVLPLVAIMGVTPSAAADPVGGGHAASFGATASLTDQAVIPPTPTAEVTAPPFGDDANNTAIPIDADPLLVNGTLIAKAAVHQASDIPSEIGQAASKQAVDGPYNAAAVGQIEDLTLLPAALPEDASLVSADLVRAEAVAVCKAGAVQYSASSEIVDLKIGGQDPVSGPLNDLIAQLEAGLQPLAPLVNVELNVVSKTADGASVDALVVTLLEAAGTPPLATVRLGHAEVSGVACGGAGDVPECNDAVDNDNDALIDKADPGCHTDGDATNDASYDPTDDSEATAACADTVDNDSDGKVDAADPGCHSDGDANNPGSYVASDTDETDSQVAGAALPRTGGESLPMTGAAVPTALAAALAAGALGLLALRRRLA